MMINRGLSKTAMVFCSAAFLAVSTWAQDDAAQKHKSPGASKDIGSGAGNIGTGAAKGAGDAAKGVGKGAGDLVTLHPGNGAKAVGKGAASTGKDVTVGTAKGSGKIVRGVGKGLKKIF